jgi:hypothetical protein
VNGLDEEKQLTYEDAFNPVMRDYQAAVELTPTSDGGTFIRWHGTPVRSADPFRGRNR